MPAEHWDMNDGNHLNHNISPGKILDFSLGAGDTIEILCTLMEQDDGTPASTTGLELNFSVFPGLSIFLLTRHMK